MSNSWHTHYSKNINTTQNEIIKYHEKGNSAEESHAPPVKSC
jgi:hypothetical protein